MTSVGRNTDLFQWERISQRYGFLSLKIGYKKKTQNGILLGTKTLILSLTLKNMEEGEIQYLMLS